MRLVLDTDVVLSGLLSSTGASRVLLQAVQERVIVPLASVATMLEYEAVLMHPANLAATGLDAADVEAFLDGLAGFIEPVTIHLSYRPSVRDPDDEIFVAVAMNGGAAAVVSFNRRDDRPTDDRHGTLGIPVCAPGDILRRLAWRPRTVTLSAFRPP